jgi:hypothetical protein
MTSGGPQSQGPTAPAGWYPAPEGYGRRYWDGSAWTDRFESEAPVIARLREQEQGDRRDRLTFWGYVGAVLFTPAGIVIGIILLVRRNVRHGVGVLAVAVVASLIWNLVFFNRVFGEGDGATTGTVDAAYLEEDLPDAFLQNSDGDLTGVDCIERGTTSTAAWVTMHPRIARFESSMEISRTLTSRRLRNSRRAL